MPKSIAIMQPYFLPYLGYWQLLASVDEFVILDDVNFIKRGWINRNKICAQGHELPITIPLQKQSQNKYINEHSVSPEGRWREKLYATVNNVYCNAPFYNEVMPHFRAILQCAEGELVPFLIKSLQRIGAYVGITTTLSVASKHYATKGKAGSARILAICEKANASRYFNLPGGKALYTASDFKQKGIELIFLEPILPEYARGNDRRHTGLSVLDVLMFNSPAEIRQMLTSFKLETDL